MAYMEAYGITALASSKQNENDQIFKNFSNQKKNSLSKSLYDSDLFTVHLKFFLHVWRFVMFNLKFIQL